MVGSERDLTELNLLREELDRNHQLNRKISSELLTMKLRDLKMKEIVAESDAMERVMETALRVADFEHGITYRSVGLGQEPDRAPDPSGLGPLRPAFHVA